MWPTLALFSVALLGSGVRGFGVLPGSSVSHQDITRDAIFNVTVQVCRALAQDENSDFTPPSQPFTAAGVAVACRGANSIKSFQQAITSITLRNVRVDLLEPFNASFHFDNEALVGGRNIILAGLLAVKANNRERNFELAQENLGETLHTLQDFYSHSNWAENGNTFPNSNLIRSDTGIGNVAEDSRPTCRSCDGDDCSNNILEDVIRDQILTTGYFGVIPGIDDKPTGKCSHGGRLDVTSRIPPTGGINKDTFNSEHGFLHLRAAQLATAATSEILENVRRAAGNEIFLQMLGISRGSGKALCLVIDTTQSMSDDIAAVQSATSGFVDSRVGTDNEPLSYILVPFNDPGLGPLIRTSDPEVFKSLVDDLAASGGGDEGELSLSGLQLALTNAPQSSTIFLFTDAPAKDSELKSTAIALIERTQSVVYFLITGMSSNRQRRRERRATGLRIAQSDAQLYRDLADAAGGLVIEVDKEQLSEATAIIGQMLNSSLVTLVRVSKPSGQGQIMAFDVDQITSNVQLFITGSPTRVTLIDPDGEMQSANTRTHTHSCYNAGEHHGQKFVWHQTEGTCGLYAFAGNRQDIDESGFSHVLGNLRTLRLLPQVGRWQVGVQAATPYTLRATGQSPLDFLFDFVEYIPSQNTLNVLDSRPSAGTNGSLLVTLTGGDTANVTEVTLLSLAGSPEIPGLVEPQEGGSFLVGIQSIPSEPFVVRVKGQQANAITGQVFPFQRESGTSFRASNLTVGAKAERNVIAGMLTSVPFFVIARGAGGNVSIRVFTNNLLYNTSAPSVLLSEADVRANGTAMLTVPPDTPSGAAVTLVIQAKGPGDNDDINYVVLRMSVLNPITDSAAPVCQVLSIVNCDGGELPWELMLRVSDGADGTGVERVNLTRGNGTLLQRPAADNHNDTLVTYRASCVSPDMELLVVDGAGNSDTCSFNGFTTSSGCAASLLTPTALGCVTLTLALALLQNLIKC